MQIAVENHKVPPPTQPPNPLPKNSFVSPSSPVTCCRLLLQLARIEVKEEIEEFEPSAPLNFILKTLGESYDVSFKSAKKRLSKVTPNQLPLVYKQKNGTYVVLARLKEDQALIQMPDQPTPEVISYEDLESQWSGELIFLTDAKFKFDITWFIPAFVQHRQLIGEVLLLSMMLQFLALITPLFFQLVMDKVLVHQAASTLDVLVFVLLVVGVFEVILRGLRDYLFAHTANRIDIALGIKLFRHLLGLPLQYFKHRQIGAIITRVQELDSIREFLTGSILTLCVDVLFSFVFIGVMYWLSPLLTLLILGTLPFYFLLAFLSTAPLQARIEKQFQTSAMNTSFLNESVGGIEAVKSLAIEPIMRRRWESQTSDMVSAVFHTQTLNSLINHCVTLLQKLSTVGVIWIGANQVMALELTIGQLIAFNMMASHISQPIAKLIELWQQFVQARVAVDKLGDMLNLPVEQDQGSQLLDNALSGQLELRKLVFRYQPDLPPAINGVNLILKAGETLGVVGPSGSGKSTLTKLLQKLYVPDSGEIWMDGMLLQNLDPGYLRRHIGVVLQENYLFNRSVRDNIAIKDPTVSLDEVVAAAKLAAAHDFILKLPRGYDTILAEGGSSLSGGQKQRIAIARALMQNPKILILDEATSALDDESQELILNNLEQITQERTVITIAHRLSTVRQCDRIIVLQEGQIIESGHHQELLDLNGSYASLWKLQQNLSKEAI